MPELSRLILFFAVYSFAGWIVETVFCSILGRKFVNRGFLYGPFCPIYAVGSLLLLFFMQWLPGNVVIVFFAGMLFTSAVEYATGFILEFFFKTRWWDYSNHRFNLHGRVCLLNSLCFGLLCVLLVFMIHPAVSGMVMSIPVRFSFWISAAFSVYFIADLVLSVTTVLRLNIRLKNLQSVLLSVKEHLDSFDFHPAAGIRERISEFYGEFNGNIDPENPVYKSFENLMARIRHTEHVGHLQARLLSAFPNLRSVRYPESLSRIREQMGIFRKKTK